jgi:2-desacetyl-2-hydroxyethyl bacteriochlorophyllide A dehydrogenase
MRRSYVIPETPWTPGTPSYRLPLVRQLVFHGPRQLGVEEAPPLRIGPGQVRVRVHSVGVCGSDVHGYAGVNARRSPGMVMGHETVGTVVELGPGAAAPVPGTAVAINPVVGCGECPYCRAGCENVCERRRIYGCVPDLPGAYAEEVVVRAANAVPFEGEAPLEWGALAEPLSVGTRAASVGKVLPEHDVLVIGAGPIGLGAALACRRRGVRRVVLSEPLSHRRQVAERLGFEVVDPVAEPVPRSAFRVAIECVGHSATLKAALEAVVPQGCVVFVGLAEETIELTPTPLMVGERVIAGSSTYTAADFRATTEWIASSAVDLSPLIERRVGLDELPAVFEDYADGRLDAVKTLLQPTP